MKTGRLERYLWAMILVGSASGVLGQNMTDTEAPTTEAPMDDETGPPIDVTEMPMEGTVAPEDDMPDDMNGTMATFPTAAPTEPTMPPTGEGGCYYSLDAVYQLISDDDMLFQQKRFVICPGSIMDVGFLVPGVGIDQGQAPLIPRSNTEFLCGEDGKSENNCIIKGGDFGLIVVPVFFRQDLSVNNVLVKGFTFEGQVQYAGFIASEGDITFEDCVFRDSANFGPLVLNYDASLDLGRRLMEAEEYDNPWDATIAYINQYREDEINSRRLAASAEKEEEEDFEDKDLQPFPQRDLQEGKVFEMTMRGCLFSKLQQVERKLGVEFGIISVKGKDHVVTLEDCTFAGNEYGNQELTPIGYALLVQGAKVTLQNNCFMDNDFRGNGVVLLEQTDNPFAPGADFLTGNYATEDDFVDCQFAAYFATDEDRRNSNFTCVPVQTDECGGSPVDAPASSPTSTPPGEDGGEEEGGESESAGHSSSVFVAGLVSFGMLAFFQ